MASYFIGNINPTFSGPNPNLSPLLAPLTRHSGSTRNILFTCFRISLTSCSDHFSTAVSRAGETKKKTAKQCNSTKKPSNTSRKRSKSHYIHGSSFSNLFKYPLISCNILYMFTILPTRMFAEITYGPWNGMSITEYRS